MKKYFVNLILLLMSTNLSASDVNFCDSDSPIDMHFISTPEKEVPAIVCKQGKDLLVLPEEAISTKHLLYGGVSVGMPYLGLGLTYNQLKNDKQDFHISTSIEGSLGSNGISVQYGKHPFGNLFFVGGALRGYRGLPGEKGFDAGPSIGLSGGSKLITGHISLNLMSGYNTRMENVTFNPEISIGLRIRLLRK